MSGGTRHLGWVTRLLVRSYPPAWQARYADEFRALLEDTGTGVRTTASVAAGAAGAWLRPDRHLLDEPGRQRATVSVVLCAWTVLTALALIFGQFTEGLRLDALTPAHGATAGWDRGYVVAAVSSVGIAVLTGLPVWLAMIGMAWRQRRRTDLVLLSLPLAAPAAFLAVLVAVRRLAAHAAGAHAGLGQSVFVLMSVIGLAAGGAAAAGPALALRRLCPGGRLLRLAVYGGVAAAGAMLAAVIASAVTAACLAAWDPAEYGARYYGWPFAAYLAVVAAAGAAILPSSVRGLRALRAGAGTRA